MFVVLPGIKSVEVAEDPKLLFDRLQFLSHGCLVDPQGFFSDCGVVGLASFEAISSLKNGISLWKATLTYNTESETPSEAGPICFRFTAVDGRRYLIGTGAKPYPVVSVTETNPADAEDRQIKTVVVTWSSTVGVMECI